MPFLPEILGRDSLKDQLFRIQQDERIKVILFYGAVGVGKHFIAKAFARHLLCVNRLQTPDQNACGTCSSCRAWQEDGHPDLTDLQLEAKEKIIKTERLREELVAEVHFTPRIANKRVFILDADALNEVGQNVLLKTLEETPTYAYILLTVTNPERLLITVRSRCLPLFVEPLAAIHLQQVLSCNMGGSWQKELPVDQLSWLQAIAAGSAGLALHYLSDNSYEMSLAFIEQLEIAMCSQDRLGFLVQLGEILLNKEYFNLYLSIFTQLLAAIAHLQTSTVLVAKGFSTAQFTENQFWNRCLFVGKKIIARRKIATASIVKSIKYITEAQEVCSLNVNTDLLVHRLLLKLGEELTHA